MWSRASPAPLTTTLPLKDAVFHYHRMLGHIIGFPMDVHSQIIAGSKCTIFCTFKIIPGARDIAQQLRAIAVLAKDLG